MNRRIGEDMENTRKLARRAANAQHTANRRLRQAHQEEWLAYYLEAAQEAGVKVRINRVGATS